MNQQTTGTVIDIRLNVAKGEAMQVVQSVQVAAGVGLVGDRHAKKGGSRQILLLAQSVLEKHSLQPGQLRENITVQGVDLESLDQGDSLAIGDIEFTVGELCDPCENMDAIRPGMRGAIQGERGLFLTPVTDGTLRVGDGFRIVD